MAPKESDSIYNRVRWILESARASVARSVNTSQVVANCLVGREIVEEEQKGRKRARYGENLLRELAVRLQADYGTGYNLTNLKLFRKFYVEYPGLAGNQKGYALRNLYSIDLESTRRQKGHALRDQSASTDILYAPSKESWKPGQLHPSLSWTHYRTLLRVDKPQARAFYEIEAIKNNWAARELERQINSLLYERLALSKRQKGTDEVGYKRPRRSAASRRL